MNHKENYTRLQNTLAEVETKGRNTLIIAECLKFCDMCINECDIEEKRKEEEAKEE